MAVGKRLAAAKGAWICFQDEAGQVLRPPVARTWARRGHTPVMLIWDNLNTHVSVRMRELIAARAWLTVIRLPAYAPDFNPAEGGG